MALLPSVIDPTVDAVAASDRPARAATGPEVQAFVGKLGRFYWLRDGCMGLYWGERAPGFHNAWVFRWTPRGLDGDDPERVLASMAEQAGADRVYMVYAKTREPFGTLRLYPWRRFRRTRRKP